MEHCEEIKPECNQEEGETIYNHREYIINDKKDILRLEINDKYIFFILIINDNTEYNYKNKMELSTIVDKLELNNKKYNNLELILNLFDEIYQIKIYLLFNQIKLLKNKDNENKNK